MMSRFLSVRATLVAGLTLIALISTGLSVRADPFVVTTSAVAEIRPTGTPGTDNGTIGNPLPSGIRQFAGNPNGTSTLFFNIEGSALGNFATFAVADFVLPAQSFVTQVLSASLTLFEDPAAFAAAGPIQVYLLGNTNPNLISVADNPAAGTPTYQVGQNGLASIDPVFSPFGTMLGSANFTPVGPGTPTVVTLNFSGAVGRGVTERNRNKLASMLCGVWKSASVPVARAGDSLSSSVLSTCVARTPVRATCHTGLLLACGPIFSHDLIVYLRIL